MMKKIIELTKYGLHIYFKGSRFIMPLVAVIVYQYVMYTVMPTDIVESYVMSCYLAFFILIFTGVSVAADEDQVMEQIQLLRVRSSSCYYMGKTAVLLVLGLFVSAVCVLFPVVQDLLNHKELFLRPLTAGDVLNAFILVAGCSFAGGALGSFLHPRVMKDRKLAVSLTILLSILTVVRTVLAKEVPLFKFVAWVLPPVDNVSYVYSDAGKFHLKQTILIFAALAAYGAVLSFIKSYICHKRKF